MPLFRQRGNHDIGNVIDIDKRFWNIRSRQRDRAIENHPEKLAFRQILVDKMSHGVRTWGNDPDGSTVFLVGAYEHLSDISDRLLRALPPILSMTSSDWESPLVSFLSDEVVKEEPGQAAVLDRILDLLLTAVLKAWFAQHDSSRPEWWRYQGDRIIERALRVKHDDPPIRGRWKNSPQNPARLELHWRVVFINWWANRP